MQHALSVQQEAIVALNRKFESLNVAETPEPRSGVG